MEYRDELAIAKKAEQMLTSSLKNRTSSFASHYKKKEGEVSLKDAFAKSVVKRYGRKRDGNQQIFMRRLVSVWLGTALSSITAWIPPEQEAQGKEPSRETLAITTNHINSR